MKRQRHQRKLMPRRSLAWRKREERTRWIWYRNKPLAGPLPPPIPDYRYAWRRVK